MAKKVGRPRGRVPTIEEVNDMYNRGDVEGLRNLNETLAKRANTRLKELETAGMESTAAYKRATDWLSNNSDSVSISGDRFSRKKSMDIDDLYNQIVQESDFLRWQTSTVAGEKERRSAIYESLKEKGFFPDDITAKNETIFKKKFLEFLDDKAWEEIKKHFGSSALQEAATAISEGANVKTLSKAFKDYVKGRSGDDLFTVWTNWKSGNKKKPKNSKKTRKKK